MNRMSGSVGDTVTTERNHPYDPWIIPSRVRRVQVAPASSLRYAPLRCASPPVAFDGFVIMVYTRD